MTELSSDQSSVRLNKHLALQLGISRREADERIEKGRVFVNGDKATLGERIDPADHVTVDGKPVGSTARKLYLAFHKPVGYVSSRKAQGENPTIYAVLPPEFHHLKPVGRLDRDTSGLLLLTNDGDFAFEMTHPKFAKTKVYHAQLDHPLEPLHQQMISDFGIQLEDGVSKFTVARIETPQSLATPVSSRSSSRDQGDYRRSAGLVQSIDQPETVSLSAKDEEANKNATSELYEITMHEGRNRQIRRTFAALGYGVMRLHRIQFGNFSIGSLRPGEFAALDIARTK